MQRQLCLRGLPAGIRTGGAGPLPGDPRKGGGSMTLLELSIQYEDSAAAIRARIVELRAAMRDQADAEAVRLLRLRINALLPLWREQRELAALTAHYYDRSYHKHGKYAL